MAASVTSRVAPASPERFRALLGEDYARGAGVDVRWAMLAGNVLAIAIDLNRPRRSWERRIRVAAQALTGSYLQRLAATDVVGNQPDDEPDECHARASLR